MDKIIYISNSFKKDFLQYSLLQKDSVSANEIAYKLYGAFDIYPLIERGKNEIHSLTERYLSFEKVKAEGKLANELSGELDFEVKDRILAEFKKWLEGIPTGEVISKIISKIERSVELQAWSNGILNMKDAIDLLVGRLKGESKSYGKLAVISVSEDALLVKYNKAKEQTLLERIKGNNIDDILEYRSSLMEYVREACESMLYLRLEEIYDKLASNSVFENLHANFNSLLEYAADLESSIMDYAHNDEWDKEYNKLVPTDFYQRNVEGITAEQAFHMVLLQFFARNEDWMIECGMLVDGELMVFRDNAVEKVDKLFKEYIEKIF